MWMKNSILWFVPIFITSRSRGISYTGTPQYTLSRDAVFDLQIEGWIWSACDILLLNENGDTTTRATMVKYNRIESPKSVYLSYGLDKNIILAGLLAFLDALNQELFLRNIP